MAMKYNSYADFIKSELKAVPLGIAQPQTCLTAVLKKRKNEFVRLGNLVGLCGNAQYKETIRTELANGETFKYPFGKDSTQDTLHGFWSSKKSGLLGVVVPDTGKFGAWLSSHSDLKYTAYDITTYFLKDEYLTDIINSKKWIPSVSTLTDFFVINEVVLTTMINIKLIKGGEGDVGAQLDLSGIPARVGMSYSQDSDGGLTIRGVKDGNGQTKPFVIAFRTAHIVYKSDGSFELKKPMELGVRRGENDGLHISELVGQDEDYHIGDFFVENEDVEDDVDDDEDGDEEDDDDAPELKVVPVIFDELSDAEGVAAE